MSTQQDDLVGIEADADAARLIAGGDIPETKWAPLLADLLRVYEAKFVRQGASPADAYSRAAETVLTLAEYFGGRVVYLPKGDRLRTALKHALIWRKFNGKNTADLAAEFELSEIHVYNILAEQRVLHTRKIQGRLFQD